MVRKIGLRFFSFMSENNLLKKTQEVKKHNHYGHRQRIYDKFQKDGALHEHELLEMLLFNAIPQKNTNDLAHRLLAAFKSIRGVFTASMEDLQKVDGVGQSVAAYLNCVGLFYSRYYEFQNSSIPQIFDPKNFLTFVKDSYVKEKSEVLDFFLLDKNRKIIHRQRFSHEDFFKVEVKPEEFTKMLIEYRPGGLVAVHNHPYSSCAPSSADNDATAQIQIIASFHNILFCDHLIFGNDGVYSYYLDGKMQEYTEKFSIVKMMKTNN
jgi:DNA repair protein RadC